jgi:CheY-like chemotaxis protein
MVPLILIVEDNLNFLDTMKLMLEEEGYSVISAVNGHQALEKLKTSERYPDLIISDIKMPHMDGYEFFQRISQNPELNQIPFIFLTGMSKDKDIRFGKMLGIDDYLLKPVKENDLLASVRGKLRRNKRSEKALKYLRDMEYDGQELIASVEESQIEQIWIVILSWDDIVGPKLQYYYPKIENDSFPDRIKEIGNQCFHAISLIYGDQKRIENEESLLFSLENIERKAYIYIDAFPNPKNRSGETKFMMGVIAPNITYFDSIQIKNYFKAISEKIKIKTELDIKQYWEKITEILTSTEFFI